MLIDESLLRLSVVAHHLSVHHQVAFVTEEINFFKLSEEDLKYIHLDDLVDMDVNHQIAKITFRAKPSQHYTRRRFPRIPSLPAVK